MKHCPGNTIIAYRFATFSQGRCAFANYFAAFQNKGNYHFYIYIICSNIFKYQLGEVMILQLVSLEMGRTAPLAAITVCQNEHLQALHILNSHEIIGLNNILYISSFCPSSPNFNTCTVSKDQFEIANCEFQFDPNIRA